MHPIHDVDAILLMATLLSSKRRPATLVEVVAAAEVIQGFIPLAVKLGESFHRLSAHGLISEAEGGFTLTPAAQEVMAGQPRKADLAERIRHVKDKLAAYRAKGEHAPIVLSGEQISAAIATHRTSGGGGRSLLMPKPKSAESDTKRPGQWRRFGASRRRRD